MDIKRFNPYVRFCSEVCLHSEYAKSARAYDYRLFYVLSGGFTARFQDRTADVKEGDVLIFPPGIAYRLIPQKYQNSNHIIVNFDFVSDNLGTEARMAFEPAPFYEEEIYSNECIEPFSGIFHMSGAYFCVDTLNEMCAERRAERSGMNEVLSGMLKVLLIRIAREWTRRENEPRDSGGALCEKIKEYIKSRLSGDINNVSIAKKFGYHPYYLNSLFKKKSGATLHEYITEKRLGYAKVLLLSTDLSISEIGEQCGFSGASYFTECFSKRIGVTPSEYRSKAK